MPFDGRLQVGTFAGFLAAVAFDVSGTRLAHGATVCALGYWSTLLIYMLKRAVYRARDISKCRISMRPEDNGVVWERAQPWDDDDHGLNMETCPRRIDDIPEC